MWWRGQDLNLRPSGYEPDELPGCSTPRCGVRSVVFSLSPLLMEKAGARDGSRTRDFQLGRLTLYQLSYSRGTKKNIRKLLYLSSGLFKKCSGCVAKKASSPSGKIAFYWLLKQLGWFPGETGVLLADCKAGMSSSAADGFQGQPHGLDP